MIHPFLRSIIINVNVKMWNGWSNKTNAHRHLACWMTLAWHGGDLGLVLSETFHGGCDGGYHYDITAVD